MDGVVVFGAIQAARCHAAGIGFRAAIGAIELAPWSQSVTRAQIGVARPRRVLRRHLAGRRACEESTPIARGRCRAGRLSQAPAGRDQPTGRRRCGNRNSGLQGMVGRSRPCPPVPVHGQEATKRARAEHPATLASTAPPAESDISRPSSWSPSMKRLIASSPYVCSPSFETARSERPSPSQGRSRSSSEPSARGRRRAPSSFYSCSPVATSSPAHHDKRGVGHNLLNDRPRVGRSAVLTTPSDGSTTASLPHDRRRQRPLKIGAIAPHRIQHARQAPRECDDGDPTTPARGQRLHPRP